MNSCQMWGERYLRKAAYIFRIQNDMAREISEALRIQLTAEQEELLTKQYTGSADAYEAYLGPLPLEPKVGRRVRQAIVHCQEAIEHDPNYASAYTGLADSGRLGYYYVSKRSVSASEAAERALSR